MNIQCTMEQIEEKRRMALERLNKKSGISNSSFTHENSPASKPTTSASPRYKFGVAKSNIPQTYSSKPYERPNAVLQFYGKEAVSVVTAKCVLLSEDRFVVLLSAFSPVAIEVFKTVPSRSYDIKTKNWSFLMSDYEALASAFQSLKPRIVFEKMPTFVLKCINCPKRDYWNMELSNIDPELCNALMPFQRDGVCFGIDKNGRCLIADEMGLGKTFQALGIADYYRKDWPLLIVTTATMKNVWEETIIQYLPTVSIMYIQYMTATKDYINDAKILIVSHDLMSRAVDKLLERNFGVIIIDESHTFKNFKTKGTKAVVLLAKKAKRIILLSGTPALSRPSELYTQLSLIDDKFFGNFIHYSKRYCDGKSTNFGWDASGESNLQELEIVLAKKFMIRRTKEKVLKSLPNKVQEVVSLDVNMNQLSEKDRKYITVLAEKYNNEKRSSDKHALLLTFFSETAKLKIPSVISYILQVLEEGKKFLVFAHHQIMLDAIGNILQKKNKKFIRIDGSTNSDQRKYFVDKFQYDDNYVCAVLSITAANAGITLTAAHVVLFAELHWNPSIISQAESRAHRIGQTNCVTVKYLVANGTADDSIWPLLQKKQKTLSEVGLCKDNFEFAKITEQKRLLNSDLTEGLLNVTSCKTLDISTYFTTQTSPGKENKSENTANISAADSEAFDDGLDDMLCNIDF